MTIAIKMHLRVVIILLVGIANAECQAPETRTATPVKTDLLRTVVNLWAVVRDLFKYFFGNVVSFRKVLVWASELASLMFPLQPLPSLSEHWWGDSDHTPDTTIRPFKVHFSVEMISDLRERIRHRRNITHSLDGAANTYGTNSDFLVYILDYWANHYDFKEREDWLNSFPQYYTNIQGLNIHYIHIKPLNPHNKKVLPLLLLHGWPATAFEYVHVIQRVLIEREDCDFVFEIIVPDLPGFGYSEATRKIGMSPYQMGIIMKNLMERLGKYQFYIHAGDFGQFVADSIAVLFPDKVLGLHTNLAFRGLLFLSRGTNLKYEEKQERLLKHCPGRVALAYEGFRTMINISNRPQTLAKLLLGQLYPPAVVEARYEDRMYPLTERARLLLENTGYYHLQATKPDNAGHGADDSPVAQISWLVENVMTGAGPKNQLAIDGNMYKIYDMRDWFDSFSIYWDARCMTTSMRLYAESMAFLQDPMLMTITSTPTPVLFAAIRFRYEIIYQPDDFLRDKYPNLVQATTLDFGGHFAAYQQPAEMADSIWTAVNKMELIHASQEK